MLQEMVHALLTLDVVCVSRSISSGQKGKHWEGALGVLQEMAH